MAIALPILRIRARRQEFLKEYRKPRISLQNHTYPLAPVLGDDLASGSRSSNLFGHIAGYWTARDMDNLEHFRTFYELADRLIAEASKENVAEAARILAMNVAHYQQKYGALEFENFAEMLRADHIDEQTAALLSGGMQNLVGALGQVLGMDDSGEVH